MLTFHKLDDIPHDFGPAIVSVGILTGYTGLIGGD